MEQQDYLLDLACAVYGSTCIKDPWRCKSWCHRESRELSKMLAASACPIFLNDRGLPALGIGKNINQKARTETPGSVKLIQT